MSSKDGMKEYKKGIECLKTSCIKCRFQPDFTSAIPYLKTAADEFHSCNNFEKEIEARHQLITCFQKEESFWEEGKELTILSYVLSGSRKDLTSWGIEYIRSLCSDIGQEYNDRLDKGEPTNDLLDLVNEFAPYLIKQHCENDAIDLLIEVESIDEIKNYINEHNYKKICLYACKDTTFFDCLYRFTHVLIVAGFTL